MTHELEQQQQLAALTQLVEDNQLAARRLLSAWDRTDDAEARLAELAAFLRAELAAFLRSEGYVYYDEQDGVAPGWRKA